MKKTIVIIVSVILVIYIAGLFSKKELRTEIEINAAPADVWNQLMAFENYPDWNPFIRKISGQPVEGTQLEVMLQPPGSDAMKFTPKLLVVKENEEFRWLGGVLVPGLFDGEHYFLIEKISDGKIRFIQGEKFRGILALLMWNSLEPSTQKAFEGMNEALKNRIESTLQETTG